MTESYPWKSDQLARLTMLVGRRCGGYDDVDVESWPLYPFRSVPDFSITLTIFLLYFSSFEIEKGHTCWHRLLMISLPSITPVLCDFHLRALHPTI
jgi:hypothetical protein